MERYVQKDRRIYGFSTCRLCGSAHGVVRPEIEHKPTVCLACGTRQCLGNGLARGTCSVCYVGLLPGWSGSNEGQHCSYKNCTSPAVARGSNGKRLVCVAHLDRQRPGFLAKAVAERESRWVLVEESDRTPFPASREA